MRSNYCPVCQIIPELISVPRAGSKITQIERDYGGTEARKRKGILTGKRGNDGHDIDDENRP